MKITKSNISNSLVRAVNCESNFNMDSLGPTILIEYNLMQFLSKIKAV